MTVATYLRDRWHKELKFWRLRWWQFALLLLWSTWPWIFGWTFPRHPELWLFPQAPLLAFGYLGGGLFMAIFPRQPWAYPLGLSFTVFLLTYLILVSWRWHRESKRVTPQRQRDASQQSGSRP
jgi:hypothetical protein